MIKKWFFFDIILYQKNLDSGETIVLYFDPNISKGNGKFLYSGCRNGIVKQWNLEINRQIVVLKEF